MQDAFSLQTDLWCVVYNLLRFLCHDLYVDISYIIAVYDAITGFLHDLRMFPLSFP